MKAADRRRQHHQCGRGEEWPTCVECGGRIHRPDCTSKRDARRDCCPQRCNSWQLVAQQLNDKDERMEGR